MPTEASAPITEFTDFDPFRPDALVDPYPLFARFRAEAPVFYSPGLDYWVLSRYHDVRTAFRDTRVYSASNAVAPMQPPCRHAAAIMGAGMRSVPTLTNTDPPVHTRARRIANLAFTPKLVARLEPFIRELAARLIEERLPAGQTDLVRALAWELPALVIFKVLGVPDEDVPRVKAWAGNRLLFIFGRPDEAGQTQVAEQMVAFWQYTEGLAAARQASPRDDFTTELLRAPDPNGQPLEPVEVASILFGLLLAGHETTTNLITNAAHRLLAHPTAWRELGGDASLIPNAIEEVLRFDQTVLLWRRKTKVATTISGVEVPAGAKLLLLIGSANRDEAVFADPEVFDMRRANAKEHLSFGFGNHLCLGAPLARLEGRVVFEELTRRRPGLRLVPGQRLRYHPNIATRAPLSLQVVA